MHPSVGNYPVLNQIIASSSGDPEGFHGFHGTPLLKGCLRKYYAQTYYVHYSHTGATHFRFTVAITHVCQLNFLVSRIRRVHALDARIYYQKHVATIDTI